MSTLPLVLALLQAAAAGGTVQGNVMNTAAEPLVAARLELTGGVWGPIVARSNGQGQFVFANVPFGRYRLSVKKEGYVRQEFGQVKPNGDGALIVVAAGVPVPLIEFRLQRAATLNGAVRNEDGIPVANILVQAMRKSFGVRGNRTVTLFSNALTDDLGNYRLYWIDPGDYYINASYLPQLPTPVNAKEDVPRASYAPTYYPGYSDAKDAKPTHVDSGNLFGGLDFKLERSPSVKVRGTIYSVLTQSPAQATVTLLAPEESGSAARYSIQTDEKGGFEMKAVNPGSYVLSAKSASGDALTGFSTIRVADIDYPRADVVIGPGLTINARLFGEAPAAVDMRSTQVSLIPLETSIPEPKPSAIQPNGAITLANVQPGDYLLRVSGLPGNAYVKAAESNQREALEQFVRVQYDTPGPLDIQIAFDGGQISGNVFDAAGQTFDGATVVLVPDKTRRHRPDQYRVATSGADGKFSIAGIPPGEYKLFAWESIETNAWVNTDVLLNYEDFGAAATIGANERLSTQIRVIR